MRVLVTGAAGSIGRVVCPGLTDRGHDVVGLDLVARPADASAAVWHQADCADAEAVRRVFESPQADHPIDAVVHLAGIPGETSLPEALTSHVISTGALLEAMAGHGIGRFVYASSNHAVGLTPRPDDSGLTVDTRPRPDTFYGVGKVAAEGLMSLYADRHGIDAVACRIGSFLPEPTTRRHLSTWLSHDDCVRMVVAALETPSPGFAVLYGISANTRAWWDLDAGRALGYHPEDDAEPWAVSLPDRPEDEAEGARVGGPFATEEAWRPAFDR